MASTYSDRLKLELMETGANANTWGTNTNNNLNVLDAFAGGYISKSVAGSADVTLTTANADPAAESSNKVIELTGALTGDIKVFVPAVENNYIFFNNTSGSQTLSIAPTGHSGNAVAITQGAHTIMYITNDNRVVDIFAGSLGTLGVKGATTFNDDVTIATGKALNTENVTIRANGQVQATLFTGSGAGLTGVEPFPSGTKQIFYQASAPTGWTQDTATALGNAAMRVVVGTGGGTGGSDTFQTTFGGSRTLTTGSIPVSGSVSVSGSVGATTLSVPTIASHCHCGANPDRDNPSGGRAAGCSATGGYNSDFETSNTGGGGSHTHPFSVSSSSLTGATTADTPLSIPSMDLKFANVIVAAKD